MKTSKITTTFPTLSLVLFMSVTTIAKPVINPEGDLVKTGVKKQIEAVKSVITETAAPAQINEFRHLRFDENKFNTGSRAEELPMNYMRFDANTFPVGITSEITDLPVMNQFDYLRFDGTNFDNAADLSEMPVKEFDYLRFDANNYSAETSVANDELPVN